MPDEPQPPESRASFLELIKSRERGKLKVYIGSFAGVGKTYRMLQEGHDLRRRGIDVVVGFVETHGRAETEAQLNDLEVVPRRRVEYHGVVLEEMDVDAVIARAPAVALVDELAHTNVPGAKHTKRWADVEELLDNGISVISALNIQHIESLNDVVQEALGVTVRETVPDWILAQADQVVNLDISAEDLRQRLIEGKIYTPDKVQAALANFFTEENLTTLRELALREVASSVDRIREGIVSRNATAERSGERPGDRTGRTVDRIVVAMSSNPPYTQMLLRKASRIAGRLNSDWYCVYVQTPEERSDRIDAAIQRRLVENIQAAQAMGAEVVKLEGSDVAAAICEFARTKNITLVIVGQSRRGWLDHLRRGSVIDKLINNRQNLDVLITSFDERQGNGGRKSPVKISYRLYAAVAPSLLGVVLVAALSYWGQYAHTAPESVIILAAVAVVVSLIVAWRNTRYVVQRVERLAALNAQLSDVELAPGGKPLRRLGDILLVAGADEIDSIERALQSLSQDVAEARADAARSAQAAEQREHEYAALIAEVAASGEKYINDTRMPVHILLTAQFGELNDNQEEMLGTAESALGALGEEIKRLRAIAEIDRGKLTMVKESIHVGDMLRSLYPMLRAQAHKAGIQLNFDIDPALPRVLGDSPRLRDALRLIFVNALRYTVPGSTTTIGAVATATHIVITVNHGASHEYNSNALLAQRLIVAQDGTVDDTDGKTVIRLRRFTDALTPTISNP